MTPGRGPDRAGRKVASDGMRRAVLRGLIASLGWVALAACLWLIGGDGASAEAAGAGRGWLLALAGFVLPLALIWLAVWSALGLARLRAEAADLRAALSSLQPAPPVPAGRGAGDRAAFRAPGRGDAAPADPAPPDRAAADRAPADPPAAERAGSGRAGSDPLAHMAPPLPAGPAGAAATSAPASAGWGGAGRRTAIPAPPASGGARAHIEGTPGRGDGVQGGLALGPAPPPELTATELFLALNFPDGPEDREAIRCLRLALGDPGLARLIRAAQDVVTLLAGQGIYMDDLALPEAHPRAWRCLAEGLRGARIASLAGAGDTATLAVVRGLLRRDEVFRDAAHHFLRQFDRLLARHAAGDDDGMLVALGETRSGRAFLLLAEATGIIVPAPCAADPGAEPAQPGTQDAARR